MSAAVLLHVCCGPCSIVPARVLRAEAQAVAAELGCAGEALELVGFYHNPNIHPVAEYARRRDALLAARERIGLDALVVDDAGYDPAAWFRAVSGREEPGVRCEACYRLRLTRTAEQAKRMGAAAFTTTLLYSKYQNHELITATAREAADAAGVAFLYRDFRPGWKEGITTSKSWGMYRQDYCGCLYSDLERRRDLLGMG